MIVNKPNPWGKISGKLRISKQNAMKMFGFKMKENEKYVIFSIRNKKQVISHYYSRNPGPPPDKRFRQNFSKITKIYAKLTETKKVWIKYAKGKRLSPLQLFMKENKINKKGWKELIITKGELETPKVHYAYYKLPEKKIVVVVGKENKDYELHLVLIDTKKINVKELLLHRRGKVEISTGGMAKPIICLYFKNRDKVSDSVTIIPKLRRENWYKPLT